MDTSGTTVAHTLLTLADMKSLNLEELASVSGGVDWQKTGNWLQQRGYDVSEGTSMFKSLWGIDEYHPANPSTFAQYNALRQMHGRDPLPNTPQPAAKQ